jgi:arylsulfatase A-like enzyme
VWNLLKELHAQGKLTPPQAFLCQPRMPDEELYDLANDPHEIVNLAGSNAPEHQAALKRLRAELERWIVETDDQGRFPEPPGTRTGQNAAAAAAERAATNVIKTPAR